MSDPKPSSAQQRPPIRQWPRIGLASATRLVGVLVRTARILIGRLPLALISFYRALTDADDYRTLADLRAGKRPRIAPAAAIEPVTLQSAGPDSALVLLGLLQKEGRLIDFLQEDVTGYSDAEVGTAARVVHQGCRRVLQEHLSIEPVRGEAEGTWITLAAGFDPATVRPTGNVVGDPPFTGALVHRGWRATEVRLPQVASTRDVRILAAAEVEL